VAEETFDIVYKTETSEARPGIEYLKGATIALGEFAFSSAEQIRKMGSAATTTSKNLTTLGQAIDGLSAKRAGLIDLVLPFEFLDTALKAVRQGLAGTASDLRDFADRGKDVGRVSYAMTGLADGALKAAGNVGGLSKALGGLAAEAPKIATAKTEMVGFQRSAYGAMKNVEETGTAVANVATQAAGLKGAGATFAALGTGAKGFRGEVDKTTPSVGSLGTSMLGLHARIAMFNALKDAVQDLGRAFTDARKTSDEWAKGNLSRRDDYRELANLQGKSEPDDEVVGGALRFRIATGLDDQAANDALRRFEGELPAAKDAGNITGNATSGVAGDFLRETARTGVRVGLSGGTSGLLAAKLAMTEPIPDAKTGAGKFSTIVDLLNRGSGDLTPLVNSLINTAGGNVGKGMAFKNLPELAAALEVSSANASPAMAGTRIRQAVTGLDRLRAGDDKPQLTDEQKKGMTAAQIEKKQGTGVKLGLKQDDFAGNIERLGSYLDTQKDPQAALISLGLKNQTERRSLLQLTQNRARLRTETDAANKGVDPKLNAEANDKFFAGDTAQMRVAKAKNDAAEFVRARENEKLQVARKAAESRLKSSKQLDTPASNWDETMGDNPVTRAGAVAAMKAAGKTVPLELYPLAMGGKPTRQLSVDKEAMRSLTDEGKRVGIDTDRFMRNQPDDAGFEDRFNGLATEVQKRGGNPYGGGGPGGQVSTDVLLQALIREVQRGNQIAEQGMKQAANPGFLPVIPRASIVGAAIGDTLGQWGMGFSE
jgi:hypothetical protein